MLDPFVAHDDHDWTDADPRSTWYLVDPEDRVLLFDGEVPSGSEPPVTGESVHLLGLDDGKPVWASRIVNPDEVPSMGQWLPLRQLFGSVPEEHFALAGRAAQVLAWDRDHQFCGRCGVATVSHHADRAKTCNSCSLLAYPRLNPAVIMLVERDDGKALLAWGVQFPARFYSPLAGFVEPGESLESAVAREVREEVGIEIGSIDYFGSQPWPFPHSMMVGFNARYKGGDLVFQESEIIEADWYAQDKLPPTPRGGMSIAGWMIDDWVERTTSRR